MRPPATTPRALVLILLLFLALCASAGLLQYQKGGFSSDLGGDPDEAAHAVTALMVHDYLWEKWGQSPMAFASSYYEAFPKVALGHYPPGYYAVAAAALTLWCDPKALIALQAILLALLGTAGWIFAKRWLPQKDGWLALFPAFILLLQTETLRVSCHVMADLQLCGLVFAALWAWLRYLQHPTWNKSLLFGVLAAAAILTKGSAIGLGGLPLLTLLLGRRWSDCKRLDWWGAALPVLVLAGPWMAYSVRFTQEGFVSQQPWAFFIDALSYYAERLPVFYGWPLFVVLAVALARTCYDALHRQLDPTRLVLSSGWISMLLLVMIVPSGLSPRYLLPGLLPATLLILNEVRFWTNRWPASSWPLSQTACLRLIMAVLGLAFVVTAPPLPTKNVSGYTEVVSHLLSEREPTAKSIWLIASDPRGEGATIAAAAFQVADRTSGRLTILRGSKSLVSSDWMGRDYKAKYSDQATLLKLLDSLSIDTLLLDLSVPEAQLKPHEIQLKAALESPDSDWLQMRLQTIHRHALTAPGELRIYRRRPPTPHS